MKFKKRKLIGLALIGILVFSGCQAAYQTPEAEPKNDFMFAITDEDGRAEDNAKVKIGEVYTLSSADVQLDLDSSSTADVGNAKVVKTAELNLEVIDLEKVVNEINTLVEISNGFVQSSSRREYESYNQVNIVIRVPVAHFDDIHNELTNLGDVKVDNISSQDVTEEYLDLEVRLSTFEAKRKSFTRLLEKATTVTDILKIEKELNKVIYDIESLKGKMQYLDRQVAMSTIKLNVAEKNPVSSFKNNYSERFSFALQDGWGSMLNFLMNIVLKLVWILPFVPFILLAIFLFIKIKKKIQALIASRRNKDLDS